jgi:hypothetical protein
MDFDLPLPDAALAMDIDIKEPLPITPPATTASRKYPGPWVEDDEDDGVIPMDVSPSKRIRESDGEEELPPPPRRRKFGRSPATTSTESLPERGASPMSNGYLLSEHGSDMPRGSPLRALPDEDIAIPPMDFRQKEAMLGTFTA